MNAGTAADGIGEPSRRLWWTFIILASGLVLAPLLLVDVPPVLDYPNHLARMYVLAHPRDPVLSRIYAQHWSIIPDIGIDLLVPWLLRVLPLHVAGRLMLAVTLLLPMLGCVVFSRVAFARRSLWPIAAALMAYNALFIMGFLNFEWSLGLALLAAAMWRALADRHPVIATVAGAFAAAALFFCHIFGLGFFAVLVGGGELAAALACRARGQSLTPWAARRAAMLGGVFVIPVVLCLLTPANGTSGPTIWNPLWFKVPYLLGPFADYDGRLGLLTGGVLLVPVYILARKRLVRGASGAGFAATALLAVYMALPFSARGTAYLDSRVAEMLGLLLFAGIAPARFSRRGAVLATTAVGVLLLLRVGSVASTWSAQTGDVADLRESIAPVEPGARVLVATTGRTLSRNADHAAPRNRMLPGYAVLYSHMPSMLVMERHAFWPLMFSNPTKQPLTVLPPYARLAMPEGELPDVGVLADPTSAQALRYGAYLADWRHDFDYLLLMDAGGLDDPAALLPEQLELINRSDIAALYRVRKPSTP